MARTALPGMLGVVTVRPWLCLFDRLFGAVMCVVGSGH
jgi:hypothetical protein